MPWAWGLNAGFSVFGAILSMLVSLGWGYSSAWWTFSAIYLLGAVSGTTDVDAVTLSMSRMAGGAPALVEKPLCRHRA